MNIKDVKVGMRLRSTQRYQQTHNEIEVTDLFERVVEKRQPAFRYRIPDDLEPGELHWSMPFLRDGHETWSVRPDGEIDWEPMEWPALTAELAEREAMAAVWDEVPIEC